MAIQEETLAALESGDVATIRAVLDRRMLIVERAWESDSGRMMRRHRVPAR
jgi:hypothetical protein